MSLNICTHKAENAFPFLDHQQRMNHHHPLKSVTDYCYSSKIRGEKEIRRHWSFFNDAKKHDHFQVNHFNTCRTVRTVASLSWCQPRGTSKANATWVFYYNKKEDQRGQKANKKKGRGKETWHKQNVWLPLSLFCA